MFEESSLNEKNANLSLNVEKTGMTEWLSLWVF
jgi:hypothetical protein